MGLYNEQWTGHPNSCINTPVQYYHNIDNKNEFDNLGSNDLWVIITWGCGIQSSFTR